MYTKCDVMFMTNVTCLLRMASTRFDLHNKCSCALVRMFCVVPASL